MNKLENFLEKTVFSASFTYNNVEYYPVYYTLIALNIFLFVGGIIACNRCRSRNNKTAHIESTRKAKPKAENKEIVPFVRKTSHTSESSVIDLESEPDSDASEKSIRSDRSVDFSHTSDFKDCLAEKLKSHHRNGFLLDQTLRNPYCYQLHTLETHPVAKRATSTQTEPKPTVAKKTVSTQTAGKKSSSTQTVNSKKHVGVLSPARLKYSCLEDSLDGYVRQDKYHKASKAVFDANDGGYIQNHPGNFEFGDERIPGTSLFSVEQKSFMEVNEDPSNRTIFGVPLKHVQIPLHTSLPR
ncbi:hypothetical protein AVEN_65657-1 [Araneus ventricosus]|uniref:Uncharacterized protein n=1 Tax=Araneus ventricosus TaxID=182803 RepID=A0A4Y2RPF1_ARAVE|nr:hypothetical protein AVEN_65657-1 [Araneus ventricosus]